MKKKTTEEIIDEIKQGRHRESNFKLLFERYYDRTYAFFRKNGLSPEDCRDLTQEVFVSVHKGIDGFRAEAPFQIWLFRIARNLLVNEVERRHTKKREGVEVSLEELQDSYDVQPPPGWQLHDYESDPMSAVLEKEKREKLSEAFDKLPAQMRRCIFLRVIKGYTQAEIAADMGISVNTVKAHLHQARKVLKEKLMRHFLVLLI